MKKLQIIGHLGNDAIIRDINGKRAINFSVALNESYTDANGTKIEKTMWVSCTMFRDANATKVAEYLKKGTQIFAEGNPSVNTYKDNNGNFQAALNLNIAKLELLGSKNASNGQSTTAQQPTAQAAAASNSYASDVPQMPPMPVNTDFDNQPNDLPF